MTFILLLPLNEARKVFKIFHPSFGNDLPEKNYADDCRVFTPDHPVSSMNNIYEAVFDVHFIAHLGGWWFKMMIIRDTKVAWIISGTFELIEISLRHWLPNFWECWWDHVSHIYSSLFSGKNFGGNFVNYRLEKAAVNPQISITAIATTSPIVILHAQILTKTSSILTISFLKFLAFPWSVWMQHVWYHSWSTYN